MRAKSIKHQIFAEWFVYGICLFITVLLLLPIFRFEYATDTYTIITVGMEPFADSMHNNGRLVTELFFRLGAALSLEIGTFYLISVILSVLCLSIAVYVLYTLFAEHIARGYAILLSFLTLCNPLVIEYFLFIEKGVFCFAICMSVVALKCFSLVMRGKWQWIFLALLCITLSAFSYQTAPGVFAVLAVWFAVFFYDRFQAIGIQLLAAIGIYAFGTGLNFAFIKLFGGSVRAGEGIRFSNLIKLFGMEYLPLLLLFLLFAVVLLLLCYLYLYGVLSVGNRADLLYVVLPFFLRVFLLILAALVVTIFPLLFICPEDVWLPCRIAYPLGLLFGTLPLFFCRMRKQNHKKHPQKAWTVIVVLLLVFNVLFLENAMLGRLRNNTMDEELCRTIGQQIDAYEAKHGVSVRAVAIYHDANMQKAHPWVLRFGDSNVRAFSKDWSDVAHMNVLLNRNFERLSADPTIAEEFFAGKDWNAYHSDQLIFVGDVLHLCVY